MKAVAPEPRPARTTAPPRKTASGSSGINPNKHTYRLGPEAQRLCREKLLGTTKPASGVSVYAFRHYSPSLGRFINRDPIGERGGMNLYAFVMNEPINGVDYLGLDDIRIKSGTNNILQYMPEGFMGRDLKDRAKDLGILRDDGTVKLYDEVAEDFGGRFMDYEDLKEFEHEDNYEKLKQKLQSYFTHGLSDFECVCDELCDLIGDVESGRETMIERLNSGTLESKGDLLRGLTIAGERGLTSGATTDAAKQGYTDYQLKLLEAIEDSDRFNDKWQNRQHSSPLHDHDPALHAQRWGDAEVDRLWGVLKLLRNLAAIEDCECD